MLYSYHVLIKMCYFRIKFSLNTSAIHLALIYFTYCFHSSSATQFFVLFLFLAFFFFKCSYKQYHNRN